MKKLLSIAVLMFMNIACSNAQTKFTPEALSYNLIGLDNSKIAFEEVLKKHKGKMLVIELWASWCGDCVKNMPNLKKLQAGNPDADFVFLSFDKTPEAWKAGIEKHELKGDHFYIGETMKGNFGKAINADWIPRYIVLNERGEIVLYRAIETENDKVDALLKEQK